MSSETTAPVLSGLARRERTGSEKRAIGIHNQARMLPQRGHHAHGGKPIPGRFAPDLGAMGSEDSYCDIWGKTDVVDARTRSLFNVSLMTGVGNVTNPFELTMHAPGGYYNGLTVTEIEQIVTQARAYVGSPASAFAKTSIEGALREHGILEGGRPAANLDWREKRGSEKRAIARDVLREIDPQSPLLDLDETEISDEFGAELDYMILESCYHDLWARTEDSFNRKDRSIVTLGLLMGLPDHEALAEQVPVALRCGVTVAELQDLLLQAAVYLGFPQGVALRRTLKQALQKAGVV